MSTQTLSPSTFPRPRLERRLEQPLWLSILTPVILIVAALGLGALLLWLVGMEPWRVYTRMASQAFGDKYGWSDTTVKATPLILAGLGVSLAFRMKLWNIGAEGQLFIGALSATGAALFWLPSGAPAWLTLLVMALAGVIGGALWGLIPGALKAYLNINEIITSLMLNYVAIEWVKYMVYGPWSEGGFGQTARFDEAARLPRLSQYSEAMPFLRGMTAHAGILIGVLIALLLWFALRYTKWGFALNIIGDNPRAARYAGINLPRNILIVMALSGGLAGLAGMSEVSGVVGRLQERFSPGYGFTAIIIAWLAKLNPLAIILVSYLFGGLLVGADVIQPAGVAQMLQGVVLFVVVGGEMALRYRLKWGV